MVTSLDPESRLFDLHQPLFGLGCLLTLLPKLDRLCLLFIGGDPESRFFASLLLQRPGGFLGRRLFEFCRLRFYFYALRRPLR